MSALPHLPALRFGRPYESLDRSTVASCRTGEPLLTLSQVNAGIIRRDLARSAAAAREALAARTAADLVALTARAADLFLHADLPFGTGGAMQSPADFVTTLSATSGLPHALVRRNMQRIHGVMSNLATILRGLTRGLDLGVLDTGFGTQAGSAVSYCPVTRSLGVIMPSNSPAVNSLWLPAIALKVPVVLKPGREEPLTPWRLIQAFVAAGCPSEAFGFYPSDHEGAREILRGCGRALLFGDRGTTEQYAGNPAIELHGPGYSKVVIGPDEISRWRDHLDVLVDSISANGGRSCLNASTIVVPAQGAGIAEVLARRLGPVAPRPFDDNDAVLAGFANPRMAEFIDAAIEEGLKTPGATDVTAAFRDGPRLTGLDGGTYLRPTVIHCESFAHPLARREFLFPYASVVEVPAGELAASLGPSLVVTAITSDAGLCHELIANPEIERLNLGAIPTMQVAWDQPHEGNLFEFLYKRRAIQRSDV